MLLQSLHSVFHSLQLFQFKGPAMLPSLLRPVYRFLYPPSLLPQIDGEGEKLMTHLSNQFTQLCHTQYLSKPMRKERRLVYLFKKLLPSVHRRSKNKDIDAHPLRKLNKLILYWLHFMWSKHYLKCI